MQVVVFASRKGGSGKTTLAGHLAVEAERKGAGPVALIDVDPQGSLSDWWNMRQQPTPVFVSTTLSRLASDVETLRQSGIKLVVIDTPPSLSKIVAEVVRLADLVVVPTRPSPHDLRSIGATVELVEELNKPLIFVLNSATQRARVTTESVKLLSQHGTLAPSILHQRVDFAASMIDGRTVMELPGSNRASDEVADLWDYLDQRLNGTMRRRGLPGLPKGVAAGHAENETTLTGVA